jgi:hypothetical protein
MTYEIRGSDAEQMNLAVLKVMDRENRELVGVENHPIADLQRLSFDVAGNRRLHRRLMAELKAAPSVEDVRSFRDPEDE